MPGSGQMLSQPESGLTQPDYALPLTVLTIAASGRLQSLRLVSEIYMYNKDLEYSI